MLLLGGRRALLLGGGGGASLGGRLGDDHRRLLLLLGGCRLLLLGCGLLLLGGGRGCGGGSGLSGGRGLLLGGRRLLSGARRLLCSRRHGRGRRSLSGGGDRCGFRVGSCKQTRPSDDQRNQAGHKGKGQAAVSTWLLAYNLNTSALTPSSLATVMDTARASRSEHARPRRKDERPTTSALSASFGSCAA